MGTSIIIIEYNLDFYISILFFLFVTLLIFIWFSYMKIHKRFCKKYFHTLYECSLGLGPAFDFDLC